MLGAIFQVSLTFSDNFNIGPPEVRFMTIPFHPNSEFLSHTHSVVSCSQAILTALDSESLPQSTPIKGPPPATFSEKDGLKTAQSLPYS